MNGLIFFAQIFIPGFALYFLIQRTIRCFDLVFTSLVFGLLFNTIVILLLTALRQFSPAHWVLSSFVGGAVLLAACVVKGLKTKTVIAPPDITSKELCALAFVLALFAAAYQNPTEYVIHTQLDNTHYMVQAGYQLQVGTLFMEQNQYQSYTNDFPNAEYRQTSFDGSAREDGRRELFFPPLWRMTLAMPLYWGGLRWAVRCCLVVSLLTGLFFWRWAKEEFADRLVPVLGCAVLMLTPVFVQYAKLQMSEPLLLLYIIVSFYLLQQAIRLESSVWAAAAALFFSSTILIKADALMLIPTSVLLPVFLLVANDARKHETILRFALFNSVLSFLFFLLIEYTSERYYIESYNVLFLEIIRYCAILSIVFFGCLLYRKAFRDLVVRSLERLARLPWEGLVTCVCFAMLCLVLVRQPTVLEWFKARFPGFDVDMFFLPVAVIYPFIGLPLLIAGAFGLWVLLLKKQFGIVAWISVFLFISGMSLIDAYHSPAPFWAARRYLTSLFPMLVISFLWLFKFLKDRTEMVPRSLARLSAATVVACILSYDYVLIGQYQFSDPIIGKLNGFAKMIPKHSVYFVDGDRDTALGLQLAMRYFYGREALNPDLKTVQIAELLKFAERKKLERKRLLITLPPEQLERLKTAFTFRKFFEYNLGYFKTPTITVYKFAPKKNLLSTASETENGGAA